MRREFDILFDCDTEGRILASIPSVPACHINADSIYELVDRVPEAIAGCLGIANDEIEIGKIFGTNDVKDKLDRIFYLDWVGTNVQIGEYINVKRKPTESRLISTIWLPLTGISLGMRSGTIQFEFSLGGTLVNYGVMMDHVIDVRFESEDRIWILESLDRRAFRTSLIIRRNRPFNNS